MTFIIKPYNQIAQRGLAVFDDSAFELNREATTADAVVLRSADLHSETIPENCLVVARAGAGTNNIPMDEMTAQTIPVMNTPGANANAVKELVLAALLMGVRNLLPAWEATKALDGDDKTMHSTVESMKKAYVGCELPSKTLGIIGLGKIGVLVANACVQLGMTVWGYDPHLSIENAWQLDSRVLHADSAEALFSTCDVLSLHVPLNEHTKGLVNTKMLSQLGEQSLLLNFSRGGIVETEAVRTALSTKQLQYYICDFPEPDLQGIAGVYTLPHLGASTKEASDNCAYMACTQVRDYLLTGKLSHCINFPDLELPRAFTHRLCVFNVNQPNMVAQISQVLSECGINISHFVNHSRDSMAYNLIDIDEGINADTHQKLCAIAGVNRVRQISR